MSRRASALGVLLLIVSVAGLLRAATPAVALTRDDADVTAALREGDVFVSARELGPDVAPTIEDRLQTKVDELRSRGNAVKMAIVSPLNGDGVFGYAARLRTRIGFEGTLLVTTLNGPVGAAGPKSTRSLQGLFTAANVNANGSATERLMDAAGLAVPGPPSPPSGWRGLVAFIALALVGAAAAVTWGLRREQRRNRIVADHERGALVVGLDALGARLDALAAHHPSPNEAIAAELAESRRLYSEGRAAAQQAGPSFNALEGFTSLYEGVRAAARAADALGEPFPVERPLEGLCSADPAHGAASQVATLADGTSRVPVCAACHAAARAGTPPRRRMLPGLAGPLPFDEVNLSPVPSPDHAVDDGATATRS